jgi:hypothetical protein
MRRTPLRDIRSCGATIARAQDPLPGPERGRGVPEGRGPAGAFIRTQKLLETIDPAADPWIVGGAELARGLGEMLHYFLPEAGRDRAGSAAAPGALAEPSEGRSSDRTPPTQRSRAQVLRCLRERLGDPGLSLRLVAEGILGADAPIDFVTVDPTGRVTLVLVSPDGEDPVLVGHALAQREWVAARLRDWLMLSPKLGIRPERGVGLVLVAPSFGSGVVAAAQTLEPDAATLVSYRWVRSGGAAEMMLDTPARPPGRRSEAEGRARSGQSPSYSRRPLDVRGPTSRRPGPIAADRR